MVHGWSFATGSNTLAPAASSALQASAACGWSPPGGSHFSWYVWGSTPSSETSVMVRDVSSDDEPPLSLSLSASLPHAETVVARTTTQRRSALRTGDGRRGRVAAGLGLLAGDPVLDALVVVLGSGDDGQQVAHLGNLLDLLLDEPLHELIGGVVVVVAC